MNLISSFKNNCERVPLQETAISLKNDLSEMLVNFTAFAWNTFKEQAPTIHSHKPLMINVLRLSGAACSIAMMDSPKDMLTGSLISYCVADIFYKVVKIANNQIETEKKQTLEDLALKKQKLTLEKQKLTLEKIIKLSEDNENQAIIFNTTDDHNNAFAISDTYLKTLGKIAFDYQLTIVDVNEIAIVNNSIDLKSEQGIPASLIIFRMHGSSNSMDANSTEVLASSSKSIHKKNVKDKKIDIADIHDIAGIHFNNLAANAIIVLDSCATGKQKSEEAPNLADWMAVNAGPLRTVIAPKEVINGDCFFYDTKKGKHKFITSSLDDVTYTVDYNTAFQKVKTYLRKQVGAAITDPDRIKALRRILTHIKSVNKSFARTLKSPELA